MHRYRNNSSKSAIATLWPIATPPPPYAALKELIVQQRYKPILPSISMHYTIKVCVLIAEKIQPRPLRRFIPILIQQIDCVAVSEVLEHN
jgi:hypothetical protein